MYTFHTQRASQRTSVLYSAQHKRDAILGFPESLTVLQSYRILLQAGSGNDVRIDISNDVIV